ncbi:TIGR02588 family protein [Kallotenue papyrolyticum]|uniref:TIGR02588 family protein n=1 Tax=Kallotenue papyrolyticum TaxID=1325125 RepID=UPI0004922A29|nr:TIGR02588 family protein [Kallotenue papyrolyticum]
MTAQRHKRNPRADARAGRSLPEWISFAIAALILLTIVGALIYDWIATPPTPPVLTVRQGATRQANGLFYVPFQVENSGGATAAAVQVVATLRVGDHEEQGEQQIDFLAGGETAEGAFVFMRDPAAGELELRVAGYKMP